MQKSGPFGPPFASCCSLLLIAVLVVLLLLVILLIVFLVVLLLIVAFHAGSPHFFTVILPQQAENILVFCENPVKTGCNSCRTVLIYLFGK